MKLFLVTLLLTVQVFAYSGIDFPRGCIERKNLSSKILKISPPAQDLYSGLYILMGTGRWRDDRPETVRYFSKREIDKKLGITITGYDNSANIAIRLCQTLEDQKMQALLPKNFQYRIGCVRREDLPSEVLKNSPAAKKFYSGLQLYKGTGRWRSDNETNSRFFSKKELEKVIKDKVRRFSGEALFAIRICQRPEDIEKSAKKLSKAK